MKKTEIVPDFKVEEDLESLVRQIAELHSHVVGLTIDGDPEELKVTREKRDLLIASRAADLARYLSPYTQYKSQDNEEMLPAGIGRNDDEWYRWFAEYPIRKFTTNN